MSRGCSAPIHPSQKSRAESTLSCPWYRRRPCRGVPPLLVCLGPATKSVHLDDRPPGGRSRRHPIASERVDGRPFCSDEHSLAAPSAAPPVVVEITAGSIWAVGFFHRLSRRRQSRWLASSSAQGCFFDCGEKMKIDSEQKESVHFYNGKGPVPDTRDRVQLASRFLSADLEDQQTTYRLGAARLDRS
jgi:hypothetical protein